MALSVVTYFQRVFRTGFWRNIINKKPYEKSFDPSLACSLVGQQPPELRTVVLGNSLSPGTAYGARSIAKDRADAESSCEEDKAPRVRDITPFEKCLRVRAIPGSHLIVQQ